MCENCVATGRMTQAEMEQQRRELADVLALITSGPSDADARTTSERTVQMAGEAFLAVLAGNGYTLGLTESGPGRIALGAIPDSTLPGGSGRGLVIAEWDANAFRGLFG